MKLEKQVHQGIFANVEGNASKKGSNVIQGLQKDMQVKMED